MVDWAIMGQVRFFRVVLRLRGTKIIFKLGKKRFCQKKHNIYDPFMFAKNSISKILSVNFDWDGFTR
jgi:hypothetical protein